MTDLSRRTVLGVGALGVAVAPFVAAPAQAAAAQLRLYRRARFQPLRGRRFRLVGGGGSWAVRLARVGNLPSAQRGDERAFALTFHSPAGVPPQGTYSLVRRGFTTTTLFLVPSDATGQVCEAVIANRIGDRTAGRTGGRRS